MSTYSFLILGIELPAPRMQTSFADVARADQACFIKMYDKDNEF
jgi:hypothetical protein